MPALLVNIITVVLNKKERPQKRFNMNIFIHSRMTILYHCVLDNNICMTYETFPFLLSHIHSHIRNYWWCICQVILYDEWRFDMIIHITAYIDNGELCWVAWRPSCSIVHIPLHWCNTKRHIVMNVFNSKKQTLQFIAFIFGEGCFHLTIVWLLSKLTYFVHSNAIHMHRSKQLFL